MKCCVVTNIILQTLLRFKSMVEALDLFYWMMWIVQAMRAVYLIAFMLGWQFITVSISRM